MRLLLIEDDQKIALFVKTGLKETGFAFDHVVDSEDGMHLGLTEPYDMEAVDLPIVISWEPVTQSHPELGRTGEPIEVVRYQPVVEYENENEVTFVFSTLLPPSDEQMSITVPDEFIEAGPDQGVDEFKFEILVRETSGNQTAVESCFEVE